MPSSSTTPEREAAKARVRAKVEARQQMTAREYLASLLHATNTHAEAEAILDRFENEALAKAAAADRADLLKLHDWDELIFGGFYCIHCTPEDADDPDQNVYWPCPSLREAGVTDEDAVAHINAERAEIEAKHRAEAGAR